MHDYLDEHQVKAVIALQQTKALCEKYNIDYFLLAGSTLGAIRHGGMIPWDDDIDIGFFYDDWYSIREILANELTKEYVYIDNIIDPNFPRFFGKILCDHKSCVDIFILVKWPDNYLIGELHWMINKVAKDCYKLSINYQSTQSRIKTKKQKIAFELRMILKKCIYFVLSKIFSRDDYIRFIRWNEKYFMKKDTNSYINIYSVYPMKKEMIKKDWLKNPKKVLFEGELYNTVSDADEYLKHLYGDYMKLPSIENHIRVHDERFDIGDVNQNE
ncbi:MAG: LicD family protein [Erysipelotrichaceae bacterium]|nr:LicD family protein [Erysipelotrichaceae bacterium]